MASISLAIPITANAQGYFSEMEKIKSKAREAMNVVSDAQKKIDAQFKMAGQKFANELSQRMNAIAAMRDKVISTDPYHARAPSTWLPGTRSGNSDAIRQRMERQSSLQQATMSERQMLESRLFAATNSSRDVELRNADMYFSQLKTKWRNNEQMLTLITKTWAAERARINEQYTESWLNRMTKAFRGKGLAAFGAGGITIFAANTILRSLTDMHKIARDNEEVFTGLTRYIAYVPVLGKTVQDFAKEWSGLNAAMEESQAIDEKVKQVHSLTKAFQDLRQGQFDRLAILGSSSTGRSSVQAHLNYESEIRKIQDLENASIAAGGKGNFSQLRDRAMQIYKAELAAPIGEINDRLDEQVIKLGKNNRAWDLHVASLNGAKSAQLAHINAMYDRIDAYEQIQKAIESARQQTEEFNSRMREFDGILTDIRNKDLTPVQKQLESMLETIKAMPDSLQKLSLQMRYDTLKPMADLDAFLRREKQHKDNVRKAQMDYLERTISAVDRSDNTSAKILENSSFLSGKEFMDNGIKTTLMEQLNYLRSIDSKISGVVGFN